MSWSMSPSAWAWHGGQQRERRRPGEHLQLAAASSGGEGTGLRHDLVVNKCVLTDVVSGGGYFRGKGLTLVGGKSTLWTMVVTALIAAPALLRTSSARCAEHGASRT